jgi:cysteine-rich repeat protein
MSLRLALIVVLLGSITWSAPARAQCGGTQLCAPGAGDCTIAANCTITVPAAGLNIDLGTRRLVLTKTLTISGPASAGLFINAGNVLIDGGTIVAPGALDVAGGITIISATDVTVKNSALIDVSAGVSGGEVDLEATAGNLSFDGRIKANGTTRAGDGGDVNLFAGGTLTVTGGTIDTSSGDMAFGGTISLQSLNGATSVIVPLNASGGDAGEIDVTAGTTIQMSNAASMLVGANGDAGSGGTVDIEAVGDILIGGDSDGAGSPAASSTDQQSGGDGADVSIISDTGNVTMNGKIDSGAAAGGLGGDIDLEAAVDLVFSKQLITTSTGDGSGGGDAFLAAGRTLSITQQVNAGGGTGSGGSIEATAGATLTVSAPLLTDGPQLGGTITLQGCTVNITSSGIVSAQGPGTDPAGTNVVLASSTMTINGTLRATLENLLTYRMPPAPSIGSHAVVQPAATIQLDPTLPCCLSCPATTTTSTTTSTIVVGTTTSTTAPPGTCGDHVVSAGEQCDDGNHTAGDCCSPTCQFEPSGSPCTSDNNVCTVDVCNATGTCTHAAGNAGMTCRAPAGVCDVAETCTGTSTACPADAKSTAVCRQAVGDCDAAERCDGVGNTCPPDLAAPAGTTCRASAGVCDVTEICDGTSKSCPADAKSTGVCRPAVGACDVADSCDGVSNACPPDVKAPDGTSCGSGSCSSGAVCQGGVCSGGSQSSCGPCETCDPESGGCIQAPQPSCRRPLQPRKSQLAFKQSLKGPGSDLVTWKWVDGAATAVADFGNPVSSDDYAFCVYDRSQATPSLLFRSTMPAGGTCGQKPCWSANSDKGFKFASSTGNATGLTSLKLIAGAGGKAKIQLKGKGVNLTGRPFELPQPPLSVPLTAQLQSANGQCWEATFSRPGLSKNDGQDFKGNSD